MSERHFWLHSLDKNAANRQAAVIKQERLLVTRKTMLLAGAGIVAIAAIGIGGQQLYRGQALGAVEAGLAQVRKDGVAGNAVAWAGQERSGDTVILRDVTVTAPDGKVVAQAARSVVKPRVTGRIDITAGDVSLAVRQRHESPARG